MFNRSSNHRLERLLRAADLGVQFTRRQISQVAMRCCVTTNLEPKIGELTNLRRGQESRSAEKSGSDVKRGAEAVGREQWRRDEEIACAPVIERYDDVILIVVTRGGGSYTHAAQVAVAKPGELRTKCLLVDDVAHVPRIVRAERPTV